MEEWLQEKTRGAFLDIKRSSLGLFYVMKACGLNTFVETTR